MRGNATFCLPADVTNCFDKSSHDIVLSEMIMDPREFCETVIMPDLEQLRNSQSDFRAAYHAITSVDALAAHIFAWCKSNAKSKVANFRDDIAYRQFLAGKDGDFALLRDIAKAQKHVNLIRGNPKVSKAENVSVSQVTWDGGMLWDSGVGWDGEQVAVTTNDGAYRVILPLVKRGYHLL